LQKTEILVAAAVAATILIVDLSWISGTLLKNSFDYEAAVAVIAAISVGAALFLLKPWRKLRMIASSRGYLVQGDELVTKPNGGTRRVFRGMEVQDVREETDDRRQAFAEYKELYDRFRTMVLSLSENKVPVQYSFSLGPRVVRRLVKNREQPQNNDEVFESNVALITFGDAETLDEAARRAEKNALMMRSSLQTAFPSVVIKNLKGAGLLQLQTRFFRDQEAEMQDSG